MLNYWFLRNEKRRRENNEDPFNSKKVKLTRTQAAASVTKERGEFCRDWLWKERTRSGYVRTISQRGASDENNAESSDDRIVSNQFSRGIQRARFLPLNGP